MKIKSLLLAIALGVTAPAFATDYYVSPEGAGSKDGSSWENAFGTAEFEEKAKTNADGDVYYFAGGVYKLSAHIVFPAATSASLIGNADGERTVFSGDKDDSNGPTSSDLARLIRFQTNTVNGDSSRPVRISNIDFTCVYFLNDTPGSNFGALALDNCGDVLVENCKFYYMWSNGQQGGPCVFSYRSTAMFKNCEFYNNSCNYRSAVVRLTSNAAAKGVTTFADCVFRNNTNYHGVGGVILFQQGKELNIINCTISGNKAASDGMVHFNGSDDTYARKVTIINTTIAGNAATESAIPQISTTQTAQLNLANSIIVSNDKEVAAIEITGNAENEKHPFTLVSGGYNYVGGVSDAVSESTKVLGWLDTDKVAAENTYASIFKNNTLNKDNKLMPYVYVQGASSEQLTEATKEWSLPAGINFAGRGTNVTPGAYAVTEAEIKANNETTNAISSIMEADVRIVNLGGGLYSVEGYEGMVEVYSLSGARVMNVAAPTVDLGSLANGVYVLRAGTTTMKVVR